MITSDVMRQKLATYGIWTYRSAWALEIVAAIIGLTTGLALGYTAFVGSSDATQPDFILASAPFFMVALAELTKIPIATLLFSARAIWKPILLILLLLLALITFETVFMGLERATTLRQLKYQELVKEKQQRNAQLQNLEFTIKDIEENTSVQAAQANLEKINQLAEDERRSINEQIAQVDRELEGQVVLTPEAARVRDQLKEAEAKRTSRVDERTLELKEAVERFERQRDSYTTRLSNPNSTVEERRIWTDELRRLVNPAPSIQSKYKTEIDTIDTEIGKLRATFDQLRSKITGKSEAQRAPLENRRAELLQSLDASSRKWAQDKDKARQAIGEAQSRESGRAQALTDLRKEQQTIRDSIATTEANRVALARQDQVQRLAGRFYGVNPEDVEPSQASLVSVVWFGSLAALAALAGPITAIVALGLQRIGLAQNEVPSDSKLSRSLRRWFVSRRWRRIRTVTIKEQVPIEKLTKEILYVPVLTDDPEAVRRMLLSDLPAEVAELVKVTVAGKAHADASAS